MKNQSTILLNLRVPVKLKNEFHQICKKHRTSMSSQLIQFMVQYVRDETRNELDYQNNLIKLTERESAAC